MEKNKELKKVKYNNSEVSEFDFLICPNCGEEEVGKYCPSCGQSNKDYNKPIKEIVGDLLDSINLDIRILNTLVPFFTKPGFLAQEYFKGKRKKYVPPMRMYMFVSIIFFFLVQYVNGDDISDKLMNFDDKEMSTALTDNNINDSLMLNDMVIFPNTNLDSSKKEKDMSFSDVMSEEKKEEIKQEVLNDSTTDDSVKEMVVGGLNAMDKKELFFEKFLKNTSKVVFLLMPFFALILAMILWKSKKMYVHHLIFSINFHSFIFGLSSVVIVLGEIFPEAFSDYVLYLWWGIPLYLLFGIKRFYNRGYISAFFKTFGSLLLYSFIISVVLIAILAVTAKGFYDI